jgi:hypothetical protein
MTKQIFDRMKKTAAILLAVFFVVALTASAGAAACNSCSSCPSCSSCSSCPSCSACSSCPSCDSCSSCPSCDSCPGYTWTYDPCTGTWSWVANGPTWQDWFNAFKNDGFDTWSGVNFAGLLNL